MPWLLLTDSKVVAKLTLNARPIAKRVMFLDQPWSEDEDENIIRFLMRDVAYQLHNKPLPAADQVYELLCFNTDPASVLVRNGTADEFFACFTWSGPGGPLTGSADDRIRLLADLLETEFRKAS